MLRGGAASREGAHAAAHGGGTGAQQVVPSSTSRASLAQRHDHHDQQHHHSKPQPWRQRDAPGGPPREESARGRPRHDRPEPQQRRERERPARNGHEPPPQQQHQQQQRRQREGSAERPSCDHAPHDRRHGSSSKEGTRARASGPPQQASSAPPEAPQAHNPRHDACMRTIFAARDVLELQRIWQASRELASEAQAPARRQAQQPRRAEAGKGGGARAAAPPPPKAEAQASDERTAVSAHGTLLSSGALATLLPFPLAGIGWRGRVGAACGTRQMQRVRAPRKKTWGVGRLAAVAVRRCTPCASRTRWP